MTEVGLASPPGMIAVGMGNDGTVDALFRYEGTTCSNMGRAIRFHYHVTLGPRDDGSFEIKGLPASTVTDEETVTWSFGGVGYSGAPTNASAYKYDDKIKVLYISTETDFDTLVEIRDAITKKLWPLGNDVTFIPGHGPTSTFGRERQTNAFVSDYALS